jgi:hypothetical protein
MLRVSNCLHNLKCRWLPINSPNMLLPPETMFLCRITISQSKDLADKTILLRRLGNELYQEGFPIFTVH